MNPLQSDYITGPLYLYAISRHICPSLGDLLAGLAGATQHPPQCIDVAGRSVLVGRHDGSEILQTRRRMLAHTKVLEAAMAAGPLLPMRFGHVARDYAALEGLLESHSDDIEAQFERISDHVEIGVRVSFPRPAALEAVLTHDQRLAAQRDRLRGRGAEAHFDRIELGRQVAEHLDRRRTTAQHALVQALAPRCADHVLKAPDDDVQVLRLECLVAEGDILEIGRVAEKCARDTGFAPMAEPEVHMIGPVPPYHFVDLALASPEGAAWV